MMPLQATTVGNAYFVTHAEIRSFQKRSPHSHSIYLILYLNFFNLLICDLKILSIFVNLGMKLAELLLIDDNYVPYTAIQFNSN